MCNSNCNNRPMGNGFFQNYQAFWIIVVIAIVVIWVHYSNWNRSNCGMIGNGCGCQNDPCYDPNPCC